MAKIFSREKWLADVVGENWYNEQLYKDMEWSHVCDGGKVINKAIYKGGHCYGISDEWCIEQEGVK